MNEHRFSFSARTYDRHARPQQALAENVLRHLPAAEPDRILELGAGTGRLTRLLAQRYPKARIDAVDIAPGMVDYGRNAFRAMPRVSWTRGDAQRFRAERPYPLIVSSAVLQWCPDLAQTFCAVRESLHADGHFVFGLMLGRTLVELRRLRREIAPSKMSRFRLPSWSQTLDALAVAGLAVLHSEREEVAVPYENTQAFLRVLHEQGVTGGTAQSGYAPLTRGELRRLIETYQQRHEQSGNVYATYETAVLSARPGECKSLPRGKGRECA